MTLFDKHIQIHYVCIGFKRYENVTTLHERLNELLFFFRFAQAGHVEVGTQSH